MLHEAVAGTVDVRGSCCAGASEALPSAALGVNTVVNIDNEHSCALHGRRDRDRRCAGLLHRLSRAISDQGCDVDLVLIATEGHKAIDVLHVTQAGRKLDDAAQQALTRKLKAVLEVARDTA